MTASTSTATAPTTAASPLLAEGAAAVAISLGGLAFANFFSTEGENGSVSDFLVMAPFAIGLAAALFLWVLPRTRPEGPARIWFGVLALLSFVAFWSGLPMVLGVAAVAAARRAGSVPWMVVGALATAASFTVCIVG